MHVLTHDLTRELLQGFTAKQLDEQTTWQEGMWIYKRDRCAALDAGIIALPTDTCDAQIEILGKMLKDEQIGLKIYHDALQMCYSEQANRARVRQEDDGHHVADWEREAANQQHILREAADLLARLHYPCVASHIRVIAATAAPQPGDDQDHIMSIYANERAREQCAYDGD